ncbi:TRAP transporter permease [Macrococcus animalis]|uniref:TRAP transporter permease n=1 Tax=Macrococcus animalis TaxID=3395467 RepID=UPI0039BDEFE3
MTDIKNIEIQEVETETGASTRTLTGIWHKISKYLAVIISLFVMYATTFSTMQEIYRNAIFLLGIVILAALLFPMTKKEVDKKLGVLDIFFILFCIVTFGYIIMMYFDIHVNRGSSANTMDYIFGGLAILALFEISRRVIGIFIPLLCLMAIIYALFGPYFPVDLAHSGFGIKRLIYRLYMTSEGIFGVTLSIASTYIALFVIFGAFLNASGASALFNDLALAIAGGRRGGPAQVAVISSALTGSLSGSAVANVATTGTFTIPLMKKIGLKPTFAAAVEATASTGGMIMPPIMGAAAFIMAGFLGVSYTVIVLAAIIPALLYYIALIFAIDLEAKKQGMVGLSKENIPQVIEVLKSRGLLLLPIIFVIVSLLIGKTAIFAGFAGIISAILASWLTKDKSNRITISKVIDALEDGAKGCIQVTIACASVGIIIGVVSMTSVGSMLAYNVIEFANGNLLIILILVMITCIVLSFGLPSTALYIVVAVTAAPALIQAGVNSIAAHFFVFWFGALSNITPPVALAAYTAAGIAKADPMKTGWVSMKLALPGFIIPFILVYHPVLLLQPDDSGSLNYLMLLLSVLSAVIGIYALTISLGRFNNSKISLGESILYFVAAMLLIIPGLLTDLIGLILFVMLYLLNKRQRVKVG